MGGLQVLPHSGQQGVQRGATARCDAPANQACGSYSWSYCHVFSDALSTSKPVCTRSVTLPWRDTCPPCVSTPLGTRDLLLASPATGAHNALRTACSTPRGTSYGECEARTRHPPLSHRRGPHPGNPTPRLLYPRHANFAATSSECGSIGDLDPDLGLCGADGHSDARAAGAERQAPQQQAGPSQPSTVSPSARSNTKDLTSVIRCGWTVPMALRKLTTTAVKGSN